MAYRTVRARALLGLLALLPAAACKDQTPTLSGDPFFPGGSRAVTLESILPASQFLTTVGSFSGYESASTFNGLVVANQYAGALSSHPLQQYVIPKNVDFSVNGVSLQDSLYTVTSARLVVVIDSLGSRVAPTTLQLFPIAQPFDWRTATWTLAVDTGAVHTPWTQPGGTKGPLLSSAAWAPHTAGDTVLLPVDTARLPKGRPDSLSVLLATAEAGSRVQLTSTVLRLLVKPSNAGKDTTLTVDVTPIRTTFVFTPQPPAAGGTFQAGGILADRTIFKVNLDQQLPGCAPADQPCPTVRLRDVRLNRVSLLLRPLPVPLGYDPLRSVPLELYLVQEPELGRRAPLVPSRITGGSALDSLQVFQALTDTVVELPITLQAVLQSQTDSLQVAFALLGEITGGSGSLRTFGLGRYEPTPRLRIVYTLPTRPSLP
ncbi:MAG TPA: hypothetical protein VM890_08830 [Longimicrobium sp.]|nr:hypothetical protein [Longimicrobium sp.]